MLTTQPRDGCVCRSANGIAKKPILLLVLAFFAIPTIEIYIIVIFDTQVLRVIRKYLGYFLYFYIFHQKSTNSWSVFLRTVFGIYKIRYLPTEKGRRVFNTPRPLFFARTAFVDTNADRWIDGKPSWIEALGLHDLKSADFMNWIALFFNAEGNSCTEGAIHGASQFTPTRAIHCFVSLRTQSICRCFFCFISRSSQECTLPQARL